MAKYYILRNNKYFMKINCNIFDNLYDQKVSTFLK